MSVIEKLLVKLTSCELLILDDWGLIPLNAQQRSDLLELIDSLYDVKLTHAEAILGRLIHGSIKI